MTIFLRGLAALLLLVAVVAGIEASRGFDLDAKPPAAKEAHAIDVPLPAVKEITEAFEREAEAIDADSADQLGKLRLQTIVRLQAVQDRLCRDAKLDEAVAVRDRIRLVAGKPAVSAVYSPRLPAAAEPPLPPDAQEIALAHDRAVAELDRATIERVLAAGRKASVPLARLLEQLCREAKLDEALAVRNVIAQMTGVIRDVRPDPGQLHATADEIGQVWYFDVTGNTSGSVYGTDIYTSDSTLATAAVHSGVLKAGEYGVVKVTILPGIEKYERTTRCGITSNGYGPWGVSFKVERAYGIVKAKLGAVASTSNEEKPRPDAPRPEPR